MEQSNPEKNFSELPKNMDIIKMDKYTEQSNPEKNFSELQKNMDIIRMENIVKNITESHNVMGNIKYENYVKHEFEDGNFSEYRNLPVETKLGTRCVNKYQIFLKQEVCV